MNNGKIGDERNYFERYPTRDDVQVVRASKLNQNGHGGRLVAIR